MSALSADAQVMLPSSNRGLAKRLESLLHVVEHFSAFVLLINVLVVFSSVVWRYWLHSPLEWAEEIASVLMGVLIFLGAATVLGRKQHVGITALRRMFPQAWQPAMNGISSWIVAGTSAILLFSTYEFLIDTRGQTTALGFPAWMFLLPAIVGAFFMVIFAIANATEGEPGVVWGTFAASIIAAGAVYFWNAHAGEALRLSPILLLTSGFVGCLFLGVPIAFTLAFSAVLYYLADDSLPIMVYSQQVVAGGGHFVLLAIPFFVLAGITMESNGMSTRLIELLLRMFGRLRGGLNIITIIATMIFSGISGSKLADVAAVGSIVMPAVRRTKQNPNDTAGLLASTAIMAEAIPPCVNLIILGFVANISIAGLFMAGVVPAIVLAVALAILAVIFGQRINPDDAFEHRTPLLRLIGGAMVAFLMVFMIGRGVVAGIATSTEISAFAVVYAFIVGGIAFRELTMRVCVRLFVRAASMAGSILFIVAAASSLAFALTIEQIPHYISDTMVHLGHTYGIYAFMIVATLIMIFFGAILEGAPALIIFGPLFVPIATSLGINPLHFGVIMVVAMGFGMFAPPVGIGLFATCAITKTRVEDVSKAILKYLVALGIGILLLIFIPQFSLWLPQYLGML